MIQNRLYTQLACFSPITLEEMEKVRLMNRIDTKFITVPQHLYTLLLLMQSDYLIQEIDLQRINSYRTLYLDTEEKEMFLAHHNGCKNREKIRVREYVDFGLNFLEVKQKNNRGRTRKTRMPLPDSNAFKEEQCNAFIRHHASTLPQQLLPHVESNYDRITLVNRQHTERLTIDINLHFRNHRNGKEYSLCEPVIIELKQDGSQASPVREWLSELGIHPLSVSKYCLGAILTDPFLKHNRFKPKLMQINKITNYAYGNIIGNYK